MIKWVLVLGGTRQIMVFDESVRKLKCDKCGTRFKYPARLEKHKEIAHNKKKEKCRACGKEFHSVENLRKHKKICKARV